MSALERIGWILVVTAALLGTTLGAAQAQDARALFQHGQTAYRQGDYEGAIRDWTAAYSADPRPLLQYNLSQAYERLGRLEEARQALDLYVQTADAGDPNQADARARLAAIRERIARTGIRVQGGPEGASIQVDGTDWGRTPRPDAIAVSAGSHRIMIRLAGYQDFTATVVVAAGQTVDVGVEMAEATTAPPGGTEGTTLESDQRAMEGDAGAADGDSNMLPIVLLAGGGGAVAVGAVFGVLALGKAGDATSSTSSDADSARTLALISDISIGAGVIAAGVGLALLLTSGGSSTEQAPAATSAGWHVTPSVSATGGDVQATLRF